MKILLPKEKTLSFKRGNLFERFVVEGSKQEFQKLSSITKMG